MSESAASDQTKDAIATAPGTTPYKSPFIIVMSYKWPVKDRLSPLLS